jgi:hypothetical protein
MEHGEWVGEHKCCTAEVWVVIFIPFFAIVHIFFIYCVCKAFIIFRFSCVFYWVDKVYFRVWFYLHVVFIGIGYVTA